MSAFKKGDRVTFTDGFGRKAEGIITGRQSWGGAHFGVERYSVSRTDRGIANDSVLKYADELEFAEEFVCAYCGAEFWSADAVNSHYDSEHNDEEMN